VRLYIHDGQKKRIKREVYSLVLISNYLYRRAEPRLSCHVPKPWPKWLKMKLVICHREIFWFLKITGPLSWFSKKWLKDCVIGVRRHTLVCHQRLPLTDFFKIDL